MREWNASAYHHVSSPQFDWGTSVLERLALEGGELVLDVGCGTGRLTAKVLERLPHGRAIGIDLSSNMLQVARDYLRPRFGAQIQLVLADAAHLPTREKADAIFSTATFHWVRDHPQLFRSLYAARRPGGCVVAQCGGGANIARLHDRASALMGDPRFAPYFTAWEDPWEFADTTTTTQRLEEAGFEEIHTSLVPAPIVQPDAAAFQTFITTVICRPHLAHLPDSALQEAFVRDLTEQASTDNPAFELDYWRLNIEARRPPH